MKEEPCFEPSGILAEETNKVNGVVLKFTEPLNAMVPDHKWRFYCYKGDDELPTLYLHRESCYLVGKDIRVWDIQLEHPSISGQHAVIQFMESIKQSNAVDESEVININAKPYIIDLESTNGTTLNGEKLDPARYYELREKDIVNFGHSTRDYILMDGGKIGEEDEN